MDGVVLPSYMRAQETRPEPLAGRIFSNVAMRAGEVIDVFYPDDARNRTGTPKQVQYVVRCDHRDGVGQLVTDDYVATVANKFGGVGDRERYTLRPRSNADARDGSRVLILCINGAKNNAVILAGFRHPDGPADDTKAALAGQGAAHPEAPLGYEWEFNGVRVSINDQGEVSLLASGATDTNGSPSPTRDPTNVGSSIVIQKNGTIRISNNRSDTGETIEIDSAKRQIHLKSQGSESSTEKSWTLTTGEDVVIEAGGDIKMIADGNAMLDAGGNTYVGTSGPHENLVLGQQLRTALLEFIEQVVVANAGTWGVFAGVPVLMGPSVLSSATLWMQKWLASPVPPILSKSSFTE